MHRHDRNIPSIESTSHVQRFTADLGHQKDLGIGSIVPILFDDSANAKDCENFSFVDSPVAHTFARVCSDHIAILPYGPAQSLDVNLGHTKKLNTPSTPTRADSTRK